MDEFPSNSIEPSGQTPKVRRPAPTDGPEVPSPVTQGEKKVIRKIATGKDAIRRKKTLGSRIREALGMSDGRGVVESVIVDILAPAVKDMIADAVIGATERAIFGEARHSTRRTSSHRGPVSSTSHISYNRYATTPRETAGPRTMSSRGRSSHDFGEIELNTRAQAEAVIAQMDEFVDRYKSCSVSDLYQMVDLESEYTDEKWGWYDLHGADVRRTRQGSYVLILPRPEPI
ncbi:hypothetical protein SEA_SCAP1_37 [Streptomyces phage Scap1]|uniref:Uncharacterized protein n=1 Tax=Streptomyces phage Scap1 TaxID=2041354 RepID=A0A2D1GNQ8_9CAUD|nr:hypothetical protein FDI71_gp37 [Streptomyces phage Scap1]ATN93686.1 hypothetical protein SEA_SCAP1_37 [Streptomyces phage Scap1]